jgi:3-oxoadipate enol-lactonase
MKIAFEDHGGGVFSTAANPAIKPATAVVLLHAFPLNRRMWKPQIEIVLSAGFRLILPDLRGFGENDSLSDLNTMSDMARDVAELLDDLKIEKAVIGGLSMGGYVAFNLYRLFPEKFAALILADTQAAADTDEKRQSRFSLIEKIEKNGVAVLIEHLLPNLISDCTKENQPDLVEELKATINGVNPSAAVAALRGLARRDDHSDLLSAISVPTLLIFGEKDSVTNLETAERLNAEIPDSKLVKIRMAGHYSNLEQPDQFNAALGSFLISLKNAADAM